MRIVTLTTDGAADPNPGRGGWAFIARCPRVIERSGSVPAPTTSNRMELTAVLEGLKSIEAASQVTLISDSRYVVDGVNSWRLRWRANGWTTRSKTPVLNLDLWQAIDELCQQHTVTAKWVKGHSGHPDNERCDELAEAQATKYTDLPCWTGHVS